MQPVVLLSQSFRLASFYKAILPMVNDILVAKMQKTDVPLRIVVLKRLESR
jgi:hypothetical protein